jgi:hypothetical protein
MAKPAYPEILFQTTFSSSSALYFPLLTAPNASPSEIQASGSNVSSSSTSGICLALGGVDLIESGIKWRFPFWSHNRFVEFSGVTQEGRTFAASINKNSPSVSRILLVSLVLGYRCNRTYPIIKSGHRFETCRSRYTTSHSSSTASPTLILPSSLPPSKSPA